MDRLTDLEIFNKVVEKSGDQKWRWVYKKATCYKPERFYYLGDLIGRDLMIFSYNDYNK